MLTLVNIGGLLLAIAMPVAICLLPRPRSALARAAIAIVLGWVAAVLYAGLVVNPAGIEAGHAAGEHFPACPVGRDQRLHVANARRVLHQTKASVMAKTTNR